MKNAMNNAMKHILLIGLVMMATTTQAVTYSPYRGKGIYTTTERLEHAQFSTPAPTMSSVAVATTSAGSSRTSELNSSVSMTSIQLPALTQHNKNVEAQAAAAAAIDEAVSGPRRAPKPLSNDEEVNNNPYGPALDTPLGDAFLPLMLFALLFSALLALRRRGVRE